MATLPKAFNLLFGAGGLAFGVLFIFIGLYLWRDGRELRKNGVTITATVQKKLRKADDKSWGGIENYYIQCSFADTNGATNQVEMKVQSKVWRQLDEGGIVKLTWLPGDTQSVKMGPLWGRKIRGIVGLVMVAFGGIAAIAFPIGGVVSYLRDKT
jgi:hypothetical protein